MGLNMDCELTLLGVSKSQRLLGTFNKKVCKTRSQIMLNLRITKVKICGLWCCFTIADHLNFHRVFKFDGSKLDFLVIRLHIASTSRKNRPNKSRLVIEDRDDIGQCFSLALCHKFLMSLFVVGLCIAIQVMYGGRCQRFERFQSLTCWSNLKTCTRPWSCHAQCHCLRRHRTT